MDLEGLRPTGDRLRETVFNWLAADIPGARCLDLFAGTGALGIEALSRGAAHCTFVEAQSGAYEQLERNINLLEAVPRCEIRQGDALAMVGLLSGHFDVIFLDPPFADRLHERALRGLLDAGLVAPRGLVYLEYPKREAPGLDPGLEALREKTMGEVSCTLARRT